MSVGWARGLLRYGAVAGMVSRVLTVAVLRHTLVAPDGSCSGAKQPHLGRTALSGCGKV